MSPRDCIRPGCYTSFCEMMAAYDHALVHAQAATSGSRRQSLTDRACLHYSGIAIAAGPYSIRRVRQDLLRPASESADHGRRCQADRGRPVSCTMRCSLLPGGALVAHTRFIAARRVAVHHRRRGHRGAILAAGWSWPASAPRLRRPHVAPRLLAPTRSRSWPCPLFDCGVFGLIIAAP